MIMSVVHELVVFLNYDFKIIIIKWCQLIPVKWRQKEQLSRRKNFEKNPIDIPTLADGFKTNSFALGLSLDLNVGAEAADGGRAGAAAEAMGGVGGASAATAGVGGVDGGSSAAATAAAPLMEMLGMWAAVAPPGDWALLMWPAPPLGGE